MKSKLNGEQNTENTAVEASKIDAIKNIIFGENISTYNKEFESIKTDIQNKKEELLDSISDTRKELETAIDSLGTDLNIRITDLEASLEDKITDLDSKKLDRNMLGDLLIKLGTKISD